MDFGSHPCACGLTVQPRRPFGITKSTAEAPRSGTGLPARGAYGLSADTAPPSLRRRGLFLIQGGLRSFRIFRYPLCLTFGVYALPAEFGLSGIPGISDR